MLHRDLQPKLIELATKFPVITLTGPRQSGKSTLLKETFRDYEYVSLENPEERLFAQTDPKGFLTTYPDRTIIDEVQRVPELFSYIQTHVDSQNKEGMYMLAGSHNFLLMQSVSQSLAGRAAVLKLLPFSHKEMFQGDVLPKDVEKEIFTGGYPRIYDKDIDPVIYYQSYIQTYLERDVRLIKNIGSLVNFIKFLKLCAGRIGQLLNLSSLANECGIAVSTATEWLSVLEASYICYRLTPDYNNFNKRLVKTPKLYFYDTGLACSLLNIHSAEQLESHFLKGGLFENLVINEVIKRAYNRAWQPDLTFWRDSTGNEVDLIQYKDGQRKAYEIKSGQTFSQDYFKGLVKWNALSANPIENNTVVYNGKIRYATSNGNVVPWEVFGKDNDI
ncbi:MAG: ATP-binding protein [Muribaculaceae bacterium]|nr:ATP-binding protein [Muribaculaceae bacterium]